MPRQINRQQGRDGLAGAVAGLAAARLHIAARVQGRALLSTDDVGIAHRRLRSGATLVVMLRRSRATLAVAFTASLLSAAPAAAAPSSTVPVVRCPTSYGIAQPTPRLPGSVSVSASHSATGGLDAYSNGVLILLAPRGWHCHALVGADGSASITIAAADTTKVAQPAITAHFGDTYGDAAALACALFPAAANQLANGVSCAAHRPPRESTSQVNARTIDFTDPPHVRGDGKPSGGSDPARGEMVFEPANTGFEGYAFTATCTMPASHGSICKTILADALTRIPVTE